MNNRIIALFTLFAFGLFSYSCYMTMQMNVDDVDNWKYPKAKIIGYSESSGKEIRFSDQQSGEIGEKIFTIVEVRLGKEIMKADIKNIEKSETGKIVEIETIDGDIYRIVKITEKNEKFVVIADRIIHIPLAKIAYLLVRKPNTVLTLSIIMLPIVVIAILVLNADRSFPIFTP